MILKLLEDSQRFAALTDEERRAARRAMRGSRSRKSIVPALWGDKGGSGRGRQTLSDRMTARFSRAPGSHGSGGSLGSSQGSEEEVSDRYTRYKRRR